MYICARAHVKTRGGLPTCRRDNDDEARSCVGRVCVCVMDGPRFQVAAKFAR